MTAINVTAVADLALYMPDFQLANLRATGVYQSLAYAVEAGRGFAFGHSASEEGSLFFLCPVDRDTAAAFVPVLTSRAQQANPARDPNGFTTATVELITQLLLLNSSPPLPIDAIRAAQGAIAAARGSLDAAVLGGDAVAIAAAQSSYISVLVAYAAAAFAAVKP